MRFKVKNTLFSTYCTLLLLLYAPPFWNASIFTKLIVLRSEACSDWPGIQCVVIGRIPQAWDGNVTPLTVLWCRVQAWRDKNNKTHYKRGIVASSGDIITDYNDLYCLFTHRIVPRKHYHVCICDRRKDKQQALLYTAQNSRLNRQKQKRTYRLWVRSARLSLRHWNCLTL